MTTLNDAFEQALTSEDIGYESGNNSMMFPLHYIENHDHIMFPHKKIYLSDLPLKEHAHLSATPMQCIAD